jgi:hypothetical protein
MKCSTFRVIFLYNEDLYINKTVQQQVRIRSVFFTNSKRVLHRGICMRYAETAQGTLSWAELQMRFSVVDKSRK